MNIYIDCEYNGFGGNLISMALVSVDGQEFYEVLKCAKPVEWVAVNVMPILNKEPVSTSLFQHKLQNFLMQYNNVHIIADWPEDISHFCSALLTGPGTRLNTPLLTMEVRRDLHGDSRLPHNALEDARGIAEAALTKEYNDGIYNGET
jgi:hypothetical protein